VRNMSFSLTTAQMRARTKDVTRRLGWKNLEPGTDLLAVVKAMGLRKGEQVEPIGRIRVVSVRRERLDELVNPARGSYGADEMRREGFPGMDPQDFMLRFFLEEIDPDDLVTRIEFQHLKGER
jgi:hypothetical protein